MEERGLLLSCVTLFLCLGAYVCFCVHLCVCSLCEESESKHDVCGPHDRQFVAVVRSSILWP